MNHSTNHSVSQAQALVGEGAFSEAADVFRAVFEQQPDSPEALGALAEVMNQIGQVDSSLALLADSVDSAAPNPGTLQRIADQLAGVGRLEEAADFLLCAVCAAPGDAHLQLKAETLLKTLGRTSQLEWLQSGGEGDVPLV
jgi:thioredoxin-like negative regulator of GroEL